MINLYRCFIFILTESEIQAIRGRIPLSERPASSLPISGKKPVAFPMHSDVRASRTALCASVMSGYITRLSSVEKPSLTSPLPRARIAQTRGPGFGPDTPSRDFGSPPVLGNQTVRGGRPRLGFRTDDKTRIDSTLFLTSRQSKTMITQKAIIPIIIKNSKIIVAGIMNRNFILVFIIRIQITKRTKIIKITDHNVFFFLT